MHPLPTTLERFIGRVYRRLVVLRLLECAGIGFAVGCAVSLLSLLILRSHTENPLTLSAIVMGVGVAVGFIGTLLRRPQMLDAAVEADRQLDLADLLATAWQLEKNSSAESFESAVLLIANQRAATLQPRSVVLHRLGVRAWSGIGLAGALVLTVAIFSANPIDTEASSSPFLSNSAADKRASAKNSGGGNQLSSDHHPAAIASDHPDAEDTALPGAGKTEDIAGNSARGQNGDVQNSNADGGGTGAGQTASKPNKANALTSGTNSARTNKTGDAFSGVGISNDNGNGTTGNSASTSAGNSGKSSDAPAWKSDSWPAAGQAADSAISNGQIPPAYHELVREYFKR